MNISQFFSSWAVFCVVFEVCLVNPHLRFGVPLSVTNSEGSSHGSVCSPSVTSAVLGSHLCAPLCVPGDRGPCPRRWHLRRSRKTEVQDSRKCFSSPSDYFDTFGHYHVPGIFCGCTGFSTRQLMPPASSKF